MEYVRNLIKFRNEHAIFRSKDFVHSLTYHYDNGMIANPENVGYWENCNDVFFGFLINSSEQRIYCASNKSGQSISILLPKNMQEKSWHICLDSSNFNNIDLSPKDYIEKEYILNSNALAIFIEK